MCVRENATAFCVNRVFQTARFKCKNKGSHLKHYMRAYSLPLLAAALLCPSIASEDAAPSTIANLILLKQAAVNDGAVCLDGAGCLLVPLPLPSPTCAFTPRLPWRILLRAWDGGRGQQVGRVPPGVRRRF